MIEPLPSCDTPHQAFYDEASVQALFDRMGPSYSLVNLLSSFGFSELWRRECVRNAGIRPGEQVCDMMSGSGECWGYVLRRGGVLVSVDFSRVMSERQRTRNRKRSLEVDIRCENALHTSLRDNSMDCVVGAFGLKTFRPEQVPQFASEVYRILKPGGRFSLLEISNPERWFFSPIFRWYLRSVIPFLGRLCLGDIECYRMLGVYTEQFGSCEQLVQYFAEAGLVADVRRHFYGCATSVVGEKASS